ncbi:MAG: hypothetical protein J2P36_40335 [Ktedonobacteraceae bacterium]|nr:hypothetical protein [Ktedonobacteraceae bacterium]
MLAMLTESTITATAQVAGISEKPRLDGSSCHREQCPSRKHRIGLPDRPVAVADATNTLHHHAISGGTPPGIQVRASKIIVKQVIELQQKHELEARMAALGARIQEHAS